MSDTKQTMGFQTEVKQLLHLVTHALYSNKEIFLRELISNASDAADKLRFGALNDDKLYEGDSELKIWIDFDEAAKTITIRDNGIGMTRDEVIDNLGTIAKSGTNEFLKALTGEQVKDSQLIGQFGVGFYSSYIVADTVTVLTRKAGEPAANGVKWESDGAGEFSIETVEQAAHGTQITLHMKEEEDEFLNKWRLQNVIRKYSDHISFPVMMLEETTVENEEKKEDDDKEETVETVSEYEAVNSAQALWAMPKAEVKEEEYNEFYKHISHDFEDPLLWAHNRVEGKQEYISLLYIPSHAPFDMWNRDTPRGLKLYVQRVFIMDNAEKLLPLYLRFIKGVIDSNDLPLNVSREILQGNKVIDNIRAATTKRILGMLEKLAKDDPSKYQKFWQAFGSVIKEGPAEDSANREQISKLIRFATTQLDKEEQIVSLEDYVARMQKGQDKIYYITAESFQAAKNSPHLEIFRKKDIEVLLLSDRVDEWLISHVTEFDGKQLQSCAKGDLDLGELEDKKDEEEQKKVEDEFSDFVTKVKEILGDKVKDVRVTHRLTSSPACVVADDSDMSSNVQRMLEAAGQEVPVTKPILELNPEHSIVTRTKAEANETRFADWSHLLLDQAILAEGGHLEDPAAFVKRMNQLLEG